MRRLFLVLMVLSGCSCSFGNSTVVNERASDDGAEVVRRVLPSVVQVTVNASGPLLSVDGKPPLVSKRETTSWTGSGFVVSNDGAAGTSLVATAYHVVDVPKEVEFYRADSTSAKIAVDSWRITVSKLDGGICSAGSSLVFDKDADVAVFRTHCVVGPELSLSTTTPDVGARLTAAGSPYGYHPDGIFHVSEGMFLGLDSDGDIAHTAPVLKGNSGSPLFHRGFVVGVVTKTDRMNPHLGYAVQSKRLEPLVLRATKELR